MPQADLVTGPRVQWSGRLLISKLGCDYGSSVAQRMSAIPPSHPVWLVTSQAEKVLGLGCSPIKVARELGSERRDSSVPIYRALSFESAAATSTSGRGKIDRVYRAARYAPPGSARLEWISAESIWREARRKMRVFLRVVRDDDADRAQV